MRMTLFLALLLHRKAVLSQAWAYDALESYAYVQKPYAYGVSYAYAPVSYAHAVSAYAHAITGAIFIYYTDHIMTY